MSRRLQEYTYGNQFYNHTRYKTINMRKFTFKLILGFRVRHNIIDSDCLLQFYFSYLCFNNHH